MHPEVTFDAEADAAYIQLGDAPVARTVDHGGRVLVDVDADGQPVGVEIIGVPAANGRQEG